MQKQVAERAAVPVNSRYFLLVGRVSLIVELVEGSYPPTSLGLLERAQLFGADLLAVRHQILY